MDGKKGNKLWSCGGMKDWSSGSACLGEASENRYGRDQKLAAEESHRSELLHPYQKSRPEPVDLNDPFRSHPEEP